jgi:hypothetical protein
MRQNCGKSEKKTTANRYENGEPVASVSAKTGIPRSTVTWIQNATSGQNAATPRSFRLLKNKVEVPSVGII